MISLQQDMDPSISFKDLYITSTLQWVSIIYFILTLLVAVGVVKKLTNMSYGIVMGISTWTVTLVNVKIALHLVGQMGDCILTSHAWNPAVHLF